MLYLRNQTPNLARYLPQFLQEDEHFKATLAACSTEHEKYRLLIDEITNQFYVETATWGLSDWERIIDLKPDADDSYEQRRNRILLYLQDRQISTVDFLGKVASRYLRNGSADIVERNEQNAFFVRINGDLDKVQVDMKGMHEAIDLYKPAHLGYAAVIKPKHGLFLNRGPVKRVELVPEKTWTETKRLIVFEIGMNASGEIEQWEKSTGTTSHKTVYVFQDATLNQIRLNDARKDSGESGAVLFSASMNGAQAKTKNQTESQQKTKRGKRFKAPGFQTNGFGARMVEWQDIGQNIEITASTFTGGMNGASVETTETTENKTQTKQRTIFTLENRLNAMETPKTNAAESRQTEKTETTSKKVVHRVFYGAVMNSNLRTNAVQRKEEKRTVHKAKWRKVVHMDGGSLLNASAHHTETVRITHTRQAKYGKVFDTEKGTLLNSHALMGYLRL